MLALSIILSITPKIVNITTIQPAAASTRPSAISDKKGILKTPSTIPKPTAKETNTPTSQTIKPQTSANGPRDLLEGFITA